MNPHNSPLTERITQTVLHHLADITLLPPDKIQLEDRVVKDLRVVDDDISFLLVPGIEKDLDISLPDETWQRMSTVADIIAAFRFAIESREGSSTKP